MTGTPNRSVTGVVETSNPTTSDDESDGFDIGDHWVNSTAKRVWFCADNAAGAAVWKDISDPPELHVSKPIGQVIVSKITGTVVRRNTS